MGPLSKWILRALTRRGEQLADGPQSVISAPEAGETVPHKKKAEILMLAARCVENCQLLQNQK